MRPGRRGTRCQRNISAGLVVLFSAVLALMGPAARGTVADRPAAGRGGVDRPLAAPAADPDFPYVGYLKADITGIAPIVVTADSPDLITVTGTVTNLSKGILYDLRYVWQRSGALAGVRAIKAEIAGPDRAAAVVGDKASILAPTVGATKQTDLAPGGTMAFIATVAVGTGGLELRERGVYALTIKVSGDVGQNGNTDYERVGEIPLLSTVLSLPPVPSSGPSRSAPSSSSTTGSPTATTMLWPLVDRPHVGVAGIFLDDLLAATIAPGGRLFGVLAALPAVGALRDSVTLAVDPELLTELDAMAAGYRVVGTPGTPQPALTPASATSASSATSAPSRTSVDSAASGPSRTSASTPGPPGSTAQISGPDAAAAPAAAPANTRPGTGQAAAAVFLARLRTAAGTHRVVVLPYSDPDSVAMMRAGLDDQLAALVARGRTVAAQLLPPGPAGPALITDTVIPAGGAINDATLAYLSDHGISRAVLSPTALAHTGGPAGAVTVDEGPSQGTVVRAAVTDADVLTRIDDVIAKGASAGEATRLSTLAALLTGGSMDGTATPVIIAPDNRWTANAGGLRVLDDLMRTLGDGRVITGTSLPAITGGAHVPASLQYGPGAERDELSPDYLAGVAAAGTEITGIGKSLTRAPGAGTPAPADLLNPLRASLVSLASAGLRSETASGLNILQTIGATLGRLRSGVSITSGSPYTLAASNAPLLITVRNDLPYVVRVRVVVVDGATVGMTTTDPALEDIPAGGSHQFRIDASVVKAGRFPVRAQIKAADGSDWSAATTITVSSSAYGVLTIVLIVVAGGALTVMVALRLVQRVRSRNDGRDVAAADDDGRPDGPEPDSVLAAVAEWTPDAQSSPAAAQGNRGAPEASTSAKPAPSGNDQGESPT